MCRIIVKVFQGTECRGHPEPRGRKTSSSTDTKGQAARLADWKQTFSDPSMGIRMGASVCPLTAWEKQEQACPGCVFLAQDNSLSRWSSTLCWALFLVGTGGKDRETHSTRARPGCAVLAQQGRFRLQSLRVPHYPVPTSREKSKFLPDLKVVPRSTQPGVLL